MYGFKLTGGISCDDHDGSLNTQLVNNVLINNEAYGLQIESGYNEDNFGNLVIDHNLYHQNGWNSPAGWGNPADILLFQGSQVGQYFHDLSEIRIGTPWEMYGVEGDPIFLDYDPADQNRFDDLWPDFSLTASSVNALDRGTVELPSSLVMLLINFDIHDIRLGGAFDIGRFETGELIATPAPQPSQSVTPTPPTGQKNPDCVPMPLAFLAAPIFLKWLLKNVG